PSRAPPLLSSLSLHAALPISREPLETRAIDVHRDDAMVGPEQRDRHPLADAARGARDDRNRTRRRAHEATETRPGDARVAFRPRDRKSTRLNSSHVAISYAVF